MFDFVRKRLLWELWDKQIDQHLSDDKQFQLKTVQDIAVYAYLRDLAQCRIAEVGGGHSRLLPVLANNNDCVNIEKFEGVDGGPKGEVALEGVANVHAFLGEFNSRLADASFDVVFSISVVEHIPTSSLENFFKDGLRILKPGGLWLHAIDMYLEDRLVKNTQQRFFIYKQWLNGQYLKAIQEIVDVQPVFSCDMATNPDNFMYKFNRIAPKLNNLRLRAQLATILLGGRKV